MTTTSYATTVAGNVRAEMGRAGFTQTRLAAHLGYVQQALSRRLSGAIPFDVAELATIATALGVPLEALLSVDSL